VVLTSWDRSLSDYAASPTRYPHVVLTTWDRSLSDYAARPTRYPRCGTDLMGPQPE
jgi:hypothetical protein